MARTLFTIGAALSALLGIALVAAPAQSPIGWDDIPAALAGSGLLVNTTSLGMTGQPELAIDLAPLGADAVVSDLVYAPLRTGLLELR